MQILTLVTIAAVTLCIELTDDLLLIAVQKFLDHLVFIIFKITDHCSTHFSAADSLPDIPLIVILIKNYFFTLFAVVLLIIVFEDIWLVISITDFQMLLEILQESLLFL